MNFIRSLKKSKIFSINLMRLENSGQPTLINRLTNKASQGKGGPLGTGFWPRYHHLEIWALIGSIWFFKEGQQLNVCVSFSNFSVLATNAFFFNTQHGLKQICWLALYTILQLLFKWSWTYDLKQGAKDAGPHCHLQFLWKESLILHCLVGI